MFGGIFMFNMSKEEKFNFDIANLKQDFARPNFPNIHQCRINLICSATLFQKPDAHRHTKCFLLTI